MKITKTPFKTKEYRSYEKERDRYTGKKPLVAHLDDELHQRFKAQASALEIPMSSIVRILIKAWLNEKITIQVSVNNTGKAL
jgi:uncharacterized protein YfaQ (DUF2300 family)